MLFRYLTVVVICSVALAAASTEALTQYEIGEGSLVDANESWDGLKIHTHVLDSFNDWSFQLNDGESATADFFKIWTPEIWVNGDDLEPQEIKAVISFWEPDDVYAEVDGDTFADTELSFYGLVHRGFGKVEWDGPTRVKTSGAVFDVSLESTEFSKGIELPSFLPANLGPWWCSTVEATVTQVSSGGGDAPVVVPTPGAAGSGLALGLGLLALHVRKKRREAAA